MSALPNTLPQSPRKPAAKATRAAKLNQYGRDPQAPAERMRASSDYDKETGYSPLYHSFLADIPRLTSGNSCTLLLLTLWAKSAGRGAAKGQGRAEWTLALSTEDLAQICRCDLRTVERELVALEKRGLAELKRPARGEVEARLKYRDWEALPDYRSGVTEMSVDEETVEPKQVDESKPGNQCVTGKRPVRLPAGAISKAFPVSCGVKTFRHRAEGPVDLDFSCVIQAGELLVTSRFPDDWEKRVREQIANEEKAITVSPSNVSNELTSLQRHGCRQDEANNGRKSSVKVTHPRAAELVKLFDPILAKSAARLLSGDSEALKAACEAVADCDHDYLVKFAVQRAESPIKAPKFVSLVCSDALRSWKASKVLDGAGAKYTRADIDKLIEQERAAKAKARK